ncbi:hypothetical protein ACHAC9_22385 [Massilia sp. CMS3.1]|uniref:phage head spike fiber domain-containing protein n=1 Tax=Massilia sp. CMS3.1 TaxID=3373083 RepID=UPI003EE545BD
MPNLRIVSDNALERATSFTASSRAGALVEANLLNWKKSSLWRATGTTARITALFATPEPIQFAGFPFCNWSPTATIRVRASEEAAATNLVRYSPAFDNAAWTKTGATVTANYGPAPDGSNAACRILFTATGQSVSQATGLGTGVLCSGSVWVKGVANQTITVTSGGVDQVIGISTAWQRLKAQGKTSTSNVFAITTNGGATARDIQVWGAQLETSAVCTSYYPTGAAAATRPAGYIDAWQSYDYDSGWVPACPWPAAKLRGYTAVQAASAYAYGGGTYARHWLPAEIEARGLAVDIADPADNVQGYLEAACMVAGPYWSPKYNASAAPLVPLDSSQNNMSGGGDTVGEAGFISKEIGIDLTSLTAEERATVMRMARSSSVYPMLISIFPSDADPAKELDYMAYVTPSKWSELGIRHAAAYQTKVTFKEV